MLLHLKVRKNVSAKVDMLVSQLNHGELTGLSIYCSEMGLSEK